jgi:hypothetical protein
MPYKFSSESYKTIQITLRWQVKVRDIFRLRASSAKSSSLAASLLPHHFSMMNAIGSGEVFETRTQCFCLVFSIRPSVLLIGPSLGISRHHWACTLLHKFWQVKVGQSTTTCITYECRTLQTWHLGKHMATWLFQDWTKGLCSSERCSHSSEICQKLPSTLFEG